VQASALGSLAVFPGASTLKDSDYVCLGNINEDILIASSYPPSWFGVGPGGQMDGNLGPLGLPAFYSLKK